MQDYLSIGQVQGAAEGQAIGHVVARELNDDLATLAASSSIHPVLVDLTAPEGPSEVVDAAISAFGGLDILVNNVGAVRPRTEGFLSVTDDDWTWALTVNFLAAVRMTRAAVPHLRERGGGTIVATSSVNAFLPDPSVIDYSAAKAALTNFCKALSKEVGPQGIRVNTVSPGPVATALWLGRDGVAMTVAQATGTEPEAVAKQAADVAVTGRFTQPEEVADLILLLASDWTGNVTGADFINRRWADHHPVIRHNPGRRRWHLVTNRDPGNQAGPTDTDPRPAAVTFVTTEHFTLQGARSSTIAEATGRATMFLGAVSGGLVALGLVATTSNGGAAFYAVGLILLPTLTFVGLVTFDRALQSGIEDFGYAQRIAQLRGYYFLHAPELVGYLLSVPPAERLRVQGMHGGRWQQFLTVAGMVGVITAVLAGSAAGLLATIATDHSLVAALGVGAVVAAAALAWLMHQQRSAWTRVRSAPLFPDL